MTELIPTSTEAEWLAARRQGITASEIAVVMGLSPWSSPYALYHQKLGILPPQEDNGAMERGRVLEPYIAQKFAMAHHEYDLHGRGLELYRHPDRLWQLATPDRLLFESRLCASCDADVPLGCTCNSDPQNLVAVAEFKTASSMDEWGEPGTDEIPVHYRAQVLWQMDVIGVHVGYVSVLDVPRWEIREYVVQHDDSPLREYPHTPGQLASSICRACADVELMLEAARNFLDRIHWKEAPDVDWRPATLGALKQLHPSVEDRHVVIPATLAKRYRAACKAVKAAEQRKALTENQLRARLGTASGAYDGATGQPLAARQVYDVAAKTIERKAFTVDKLIPAKPKKDKKHVSTDDQ